MINILSSKWTKLALPLAITSILTACDGEPITIQIPSIGLGVSESTTRVIDGDTFKVDTIDNCGVDILADETLAVMEDAVAFNSLEDNMSGWFNSADIDPDTLDPSRFNMPGITSPDDTCNDLNTHQVVMLKKYADWNGQHVNGIEVDIASANKTFADIDAIIFEMKIDVADSEIFTSEQLQATYGDLLTDEQYGFLDKGNVVFAMSIFNERVDNDQDIVQTQRFIEIDQSLYGDEWIRVEIPFETMDIFTNQPWIRGETTHEEQATTLADRLHINPEILGTRTESNFGDVIRGLIGGPSDEEFAALNIQETYKEMSIRIKRLEVHFK